jgi:hypothetical protein
MAGFQLLDLHDFPGQGTALVGVLDPFWEYKGYVTAAQFNRFCAETVPLARLDKRVFTSDETLRGELEIAHFGAAALRDVAVSWKIVNSSGRTMESGRFEKDLVPVGNAFPVGSLAAKLSALPASAQYQLVVRVGPKFFEGLPVRDKTPEYENDWDFWVYPATLADPDPGSIQITRELDEAAIAALGRGEKVLWSVPPSRVRGDENGPVAWVSPAFSGIQHGPTGSRRTRSESSVIRGIPLSRSSRQNLTVIGNGGIWSHARAQ